MKSTNTSPDRATRFCRGCSYALDGLTSSRCPECGLAFDPNDPTTFSRYPRTRSTALGEWVSELFNRTTERSNRRQVAHALGFFVVVILLGTIVILLDHYGVLQAVAGH